MKRAFGAMIMMVLTGMARAANTENSSASLNELLPNAAVWLAQILKGCAQYNVFHQMVVLSLMLAIGFFTWEVMQSANSGTAARATQTYIRAGVVLLTLTALYSTPNTLSSWVKNLFVDSWVKVYQTVDRAAMRGLEQDLSQKVDDFAGELSNYLYQTWAIDATLKGQSSSLEFGPPDPNNLNSSNANNTTSPSSSTETPASRAQWAYWVTQGLFFLMLGVLTVYAGMVTLSGVLALLCWLCFPLALCWIILRKSEYVLLIFRLWVYSLAGAVLVPVFFAVTTPLVMVSPMEKLRQEAKVNNTELTRVAQQYANEYQACVDSSDWLTKGLKCDFGVSTAQALEFAGQKVFRIVMDLLFVGMGMLIAYGVLLALLRFVMNVVGRFLGVDTALEDAVQMGLPLGIRGRRGLARGGGAQSSGEASSGAGIGSSGSGGSSTSRPSHITGMLSRPLSRRGAAFTGQVQREGREMRETFSSAWNAETQRRAGQVAPKTDLKGPDKPS